MPIVNVEQADAWNGDEGERWVRNADRYDRAALDAWTQFLAAAPIETGDRILDIGCGAGRSTLDALHAAGPDASALGVDLSALLLEIARRRAAEEGAKHVVFEQADAQLHAFAPATFDVVISRLGVMFFADPIGAFTNIRSALRDGGRVAFLVWRGLEDNEWLREIRGALAQGRELGVPPVSAPSPFGLADRDHATGTLTAAGFDDVAFAPIDARQWFGGDFDDAWEFMRDQGVVKGLTEELDEPTRQRALDDLREVVRRYESPEGVALPSGMWLITARARPARP